MIFKDPPKQIRTTKKNHLYVNEADNLQRHPHQWGLAITLDTPQQAKSLANNIRRGKYFAFNPPSLWECVQRKCDIYLRYIGPSCASSTTNQDAGIAENAER